jgi:hypothetical protein
MNKGIAVALLTLVPGLALAQGNENTSTGFSTLNPDLVDLHRGSKELTFSGAGTADNSFDNNTLGLSIGYGWYSSPNLEFSARQNVNFADVGGDSLWNGSTRVAMDYHWTGGSWRPFAGAELGFIYGDGVNDTGIIGPEIGIKYYLKKDTFLYWLEEYQVLFDSGDDSDNNISDGTFVHTFGIGTNF